jgi:tetratricopeptide (TPR) repeat protein
MFTYFCRFAAVVGLLVLSADLQAQAPTQAPQAQTLEDAIKALFGTETPEQAEAARTYQTKEYQCRRNLESSPQTAIAACEEVVAISKQLAPQRRIERSSALSELGQALLINRRTSEALPKFEEAVEIRSQGTAGRNDEGVAALLELVGVTHFALRDFPKANQLMEESIRAYEGAIEKLPSYKASYTPRLQATIRRYADMKKAMGDVGAAESLLKRADALAPPVAASVAPADEFRILDGVRLMGETGAKLTEDDLNKIRALMPSGTPPVWLIMGKPIVMYGELSWDVEVYSDPVFSSDKLRVGRLFTLTTTLPAAGQFTAVKTWKQRVIPYRWGQVPKAGRNPKEVENQTALDRPFPIIEFGDLEKFTNDELIRLTSFVQTEGAKTTVTNSPRLSADIQPWGIQSLMRWGTTEVEVILIRPNSRGSQGIRMKFDAQGISILQMR